MFTVPITDSASSLRGRIAAHTSWALTQDRSARTAPARAALERRFLDAADGDPVRAEHLRKAYFARLALKSTESRRKARELSTVAEAAEAELQQLEGGDCHAPDAA